MIQLSQEQRQELSAPEPSAIAEEDVLATADLVDQVMAEDDAQDSSLQSYQSIPGNA